MRRVQDSAWFLPTIGLVMILEDAIGPFSAEGREIVRVPLSATGLDEVVRTLHEQGVPIADVAVSAPVFLVRRHCASPPRRRSLWSTRSATETWASKQTLGAKRAGPTQASGERRGTLRTTDSARRSPGKRSSPRSSS